MPRQFPKAQLITLFTLLFIFMLAWDAYLYTLPSHLETANYLFNIVYGLPLILIGSIILINTYVYKGGGELVRSLGYLALGAFSFGIGLFIWAYFNLVLQIPIPHPSPVEVLFIVYPFLLTIGTIRLLQFFTGRLNWKTTLEGIVFFFAVAIPIYHYFLLPSFTPDLLWITKFIIISLLIGNILLFSVVYLIVRVGGGQIRGRLLLYGVAYLLIIFGLSLFQYRTNTNNYWNGDISDLLLASHVYFFCLATIFTMDTAFGKLVPPSTVPPINPAS